MIQKVNYIQDIQEEKNKRIGIQEKQLQQKIL